MAGFSEELDGLEQSIRKLQIEWEKFFGGVERKPPVDFATRVERLIRRYAGEEFRSNGERFRYQSLTARYNTFNELWQKRLRAREEGRPVGIHGTRAEHIAMERQAAAHQAVAPTAAAPARRPADGEVRVGDPARDEASVKLLFNQFIEARKVTGEGGAMRYENFQKIIAQQSARILAEKGASAVSFRLETKNGKVSLKAKPVR
jgi:hypothetical protein